MQYDLLVQTEISAKIDKYILPNKKIRAVDKREYLVIIRDNFCQSCIKTYVVTPNLNRLVETVQMRGHIIWFG